MNVFQQRRPVSALRLSVVAMAKPTKAVEFRGLSTEEINKLVAESKRALFDLRMKQDMRKVRYLKLLFSLT